MSEIKTIGLDLAKQVFHVVVMDGRGHEVEKKVLKRAQLLNWFAQRPASLVGMEACAGAHDWARRLQALGHTVRLLPAQHVKAYLQGHKNDFNDARAIAEAVGRPRTRHVPVKTVAQQEMQSLHRLRAAAVAERTAVCNRLRGLLTEYGVVLPRGVAHLRRQLPQLLDAQTDALSPRLRYWLARGYQQLLEVDAHVAFYTREIEQQARQEEVQQRLQTIPGYGPIVASAFSAAVGDGQGYRRGRDVAAALGLVPRQHSTGGKPVLLGISKRGDAYLRSLLVQAARSVLCQAHRKEDRLSRWARRIQAERGSQKAAVALANKLARIGWAVARHQTPYQPA